MDRLSAITPAFVAPEPPESLLVPAEVSKALSSLALAVNHGLIDEQKRVYAYTLRDVPVPILRRACLQLAGTATFFPKPAEIRAAADAIQRHDAEVSRARALKTAESVETFRCHHCQDDAGGWLVPMRCPAVRCDRPRDHAPHLFTARCPCWLRRNTDALRFARQQALQKNHAIPRECEQLDDLEAGRYRWGRY